MIIKFPVWRRRLGFVSPLHRWGGGKRWRALILPAVFGALFGAAIFAGLSGSGLSNAEGIRARAIDGDTIENIETGERIRLPNIDAPETGERAQCRAERDAGEQAKREAWRLISGATVTVRTTGRRDAYGRTIGYVEVNGRDLGALMIDAGLARPWRGRREPWCAADGTLLH